VSEKDHGSPDGLPDIHLDEARLAAHDRRQHLLEREGPRNRVEMQQRTLEQMCADDVRKCVGALNRAIDSAILRGLRVEIDVNDLFAVGDRRPTPQITATIQRVETL
jgi:hypothetical protein